jgi:hypothetical protein
MIGKKMFAWIAAGMLTIASVPAIAATRTHVRQLHKKSTATVLHATTAKKSAKPASHVKLAASHLKKAHPLKLTRVTKLAKVSKSTKSKAAHSSVGVLAMHSGHSSLIKPISTRTTAAKKSTPHLLAATTKIKTIH